MRAGRQAGLAAHLLARALTVLGMALPRRRPLHLLPHLLLLLEGALLHLLLL